WTTAAAPANARVSPSTSRPSTGMGAPPACVTVRADSSERTRPATSQRSAAAAETTCRPTKPPAPVTTRRGIGSSSPLRGPGGALRRLPRADPAERVRDVPPRVPHRVEDGHGASGRRLLVLRRRHTRPAVMDDRGLAHLTVLEVDQVPRDRPRPLLAP